MFMDQKFLLTENGLLLSVKVKMGQKTLRWRSLAQIILKIGKCIIATFLEETLDMITMTVSYLIAGQKMAGFCMLSLEQDFRVVAG